MRIITWNCNMAFRRKAEFILKFKPDILIVPECEHPDKLLFKVDTPKPKDILWFGKNQNKGLGIFSYSKFRFTLLASHNEELQLIIPIAVTGGSEDFNLFAVWANNPLDKDGQYIGQVWKAIHHYEELMTLPNTIIVGDFNSNKIWDKKNRESNHSNVVEYLGKMGIQSSYHVHHKQNQGLEKHPTLYMYRHKDKPYHIDYCFVSDNMIQRLKSVEIGDFEYWSQFSDHVPVIVSFKKIRI